jgi:transposase-like protein
MYHCKQNNREMNCQKCMFDKKVKSSFTKGKQRYKCKDCC